MSSAWRWVGLGARYALGAPAALMVASHIGFGAFAQSSGMSSWAAVFSTVAYAMILGLSTRIIFMPSGALADTLVSHRLIAAAVALGVYFVTRRNLFLGTVAGVGAFIALGQWGALP